MPPRRIALLVFPRLTLLDFVGVYDALRRISTLGIDAAVELRIVGTATPIDDEGGVRIVPHAVYEDLAGVDLLVVPGGLGTRALEDDARLVDYLRGYGRDKPVASVCTGAVLLGRAGLLEGRRATTHFASYDRLAPLCREVVRGARVVEDGPVITAGAVSSSLDLGLALVERFWGAAAAAQIGRAMHHARRDDAPA